MRVLSILFLIAMPLWFSERPAHPCQAGSEAFSQQDFIEARRLLSECVELEEAPLVSFLQLCSLYQSAQQFDDLYNTALEGMKRFPGERRFVLSAGTLAGRHGDFERAVEILSEGYQRWPTDKAVAEQLAEAHLASGIRHLDLNEPSLAEPDLRRAAELKPADTDILLNWGRALHNSKESLQALDVFRRVTRLDPNVPLAWFHRGLILYDLGRFEEAIESFSEEIERNSVYPPSFLFRGLSKMQKAEWVSALPDLKTAVARMPENPEGRYALARTLDRLDRHREAEAAYRRTLELIPTDPRPYNSLGRLLIEQGRHQEAGPLFESARKLQEQSRKQD